MGKYSLKPVKKIVLVQGERVFAVLVIGGRELHECLVSGALSKQVFPGIAAAGHGGAVCEIDVIDRIHVHI